MVPILTYHSQNICGNETANNDHVALEADLHALHAAGKKVIPLDALLDWVEGKAEDQSVENAVVLTFDDGCDFDVRDIEYPGHGLQRSFAGIMLDFLGCFHADERPALHATSFVIASAEARRKIDAGSLFGKGWMSDDWWGAVDAAGLIAIENHGWDHNHPDVIGAADDDGDSEPEDENHGSFHTVDTHEQCIEQVVRAALEIERHTDRHPAYFCYPFGESSDYIRDVFFPEYANQHRCRAALGTEPGVVTRETSRWNMPRFVCGRDWDSPQALVTLLG